MQTTGVRAALAALALLASRRAGTELHRLPLVRWLQRRRSLGSVAKKLRSKKASAVDEAVRTALGAMADALRTDLKTLEAL